MRKLYGLLGGVALAVSSVATGFAADLPSRKAPVPYIAPPPIFTWTGFYIGINAGAAIRKNNYANNNAALFALTGNPVFLTTNNGSSNNVAFLGGGQIGYNWQTGPIVFGLEADADYRSGFGSNNSVFGNAGNTSGFLGTVRGRFGYLFTPSLLAYATGGLAYGTSYYNVPNFFGSSSNSLRLGYTVGGGLEYMLSPNWSIKAEYLWTDLGRNNSNNFFGTVSPRSQAHVVRAGINYHFNWGGAAPVVARY
jgi:outer membrane immunogenic protein